jgi:nitroimidazol reductase NimA-like FMN-containing flavoprotein (pyridoxamine 5'-phosphate oxidase superfamily)
LERADHGILAVNGLEGYPYAIPMTHLVTDGALLFHAAVRGHRLEALRANPRACFTVAVGPEERDGDVPPGSLGTYASAVVFGEIAELPAERHAEALVAICRRYAPDRVADAERFVREGGAVSILRMAVAHLSGKRLLVR